MTFQGSEIGRDGAVPTSATLDDLPPVIPARIADRLMGIGLTTGRRLRRAGAYPVAVTGLGRNHKVRTADVLRYLHHERVAPVSQEGNPRPVS